MKPILTLIAAFFVLTLTKPAPPLQDVIADTDETIPLITTAATKTPSSGIQNGAWFCEAVTPDLWP